jgi:hypothetical protein
MTINANNLAVYLNDHLAGAAAALELLDNLLAKFPNSNVSELAREIRQEIDADREELVSIMNRLHIDQSKTRKASAWLAEKAAEAKLYLDDSSAGTLRLFEMIEAISLGIEGKRALWMALARIVNQVPELADIDFNRLIQRAQDQRARLEPFRRQAAVDAFLVTPQH